MSWRQVVCSDCLASKYLKKWSLSIKLLFFSTKIIWSCVTKKSVHSDGTFSIYLIENMYNNGGKQIFANGDRWHPGSTIVLFNYNVSLYELPSENKVFIIIIIIMHFKNYFLSISSICYDIMFVLTSELNWTFSEHNFNLNPVVTFNFQLE